MNARICRRASVGRSAACRAMLGFKVLTKDETHLNEHHPHRALNQASPPRTLPDPNDAESRWASESGSSGPPTHLQNPSVVREVAGIGEFDAAAQDGVWTQAVEFPASAPDSKPARGMRIAVIQPIDAGIGLVHTRFC